MAKSDQIDAALSLLYQSRWNFKKHEKAFAMLQETFDDHQLAIIKKGFREGLPRVHLQLLMYPGFSWQQMLIIETELHELPAEKVARLANPSYEVPQMQIIADGIRSGFTTEQIDYLIQHKHSLTEMKIILGSFQHGVTEGELDKFFWKGRQFSF